MSASDAPIRESLRCLIVEDQTMFLQLLSGMLRTIPGIDLVATATTVAAGHAACVGDAVDLLILDLALPDGNGLEVLRSAAARRPDIDCIILSSAASEFACPQQFLTNLRAVIDKTQAYESLQRVITNLLQSRGIRLPPVRGGVEARDVLRARELEVFELIGQGLQTKAIGERLGISRHTVESHRKAIAAKLGASGAELVRMATIHNQTTLPQPSLGSRA
jgi:DNA-binding NarL/FixJ family response regulator